RLLDHPVAGQAAAEGAELAVDPLDLRRSQMRKLLEPVEPKRVELVGELRPDALHPAEIVAGDRSAGELTMDRNAKELAGDVACRRRSLAGELSPLAMRLLHMWPDRGAVVGQADALARTKEDKRQD